MADNHNVEDLSVKQMVRNRIPFIEDTPENTTLLSNFTLEVMYELEVCFKKRMDNGVEDWARVGNETYYNVLERSLVADIVSTYITMMTMFATSGGTTPTLQTYLKRAKAGSVEAEYDQFKFKDGAMLQMDGKGLLDRLKTDIQRKARTLGCIFDICEDCTLSFNSSNTVTPPFMLFGGGCGCGA